MKNLIQAECKKIMKNKAVKFTWGVCILYMMAAILFSVHSEEYRTYDVSNQRYVEYHGYDAIKHKSGDMKKISYILTQNEIAKIIDDLNQIKKDNHVKSIYDLDDKIFFGKKRNSEDDIIDLISRAYSKEGEYDVYAIDKLNASDANKFYKNRRKVTEKNLKNIPEGYGKISNKQKKTILQSVDKMQEPLQYQYFHGWEKILDNFYWVNIVIILGVVFTASTLFSMEYANQMILLILSTPNGKEKFIIAKIRAAMRFATITVLGMNALFSMVMLTIYGASGWNCMIQIDSSNWLSVYNVTFSQLFIYGVCMVWVASIAVILITALLSCKMRKTANIMGLTCFILFIPRLINQTLPKTFDNLLHLLPIHIFDVNYEVKTLYTVNIFGREYLRGYIAPVFEIILCSVILWITIQCFKKVEG